MTRMMTRMLLPQSPIPHSHSLSLSLSVSVSNMHHERCLCPWSVALCALTLPDHSCAGLQQPTGKCRWQAWAN